MRILMVGAGALGGYVGARLIASGADVTFLLRRSRLETMRRSGLVVESSLGDMVIATPACVAADALERTYDLVIVACRAHQFAHAAKASSPAVGPDTAVLPLLNGMAHIEDARAAFGPTRVLGGLCMLAAAVAPDGRVLHRNGDHALRLGELDGAASARTRAFGALFERAGFTQPATDTIMLEMWEKWMFIASAFCLTALTRMHPRTPSRASGKTGTSALLNECRRIASAAGFAPRPAALARSKLILDDPRTELPAMIHEDWQRRYPTEAEYILRDLLARAGASAIDTPLAANAYQALLTQETATQPCVSSQRADGIPADAASATLELPST